MKFVSIAAVALLLASLAGCGGGSSSAPPPNSVTLDTTATVLQVADPHDPAHYPTAAVHVGFHGAGVVVGSLPGQLPPDWLSVSAPSSTTQSPVTVTLALAQVAYTYAPGSYSTTLRFVTGNADLTGQVYQDLPITMVIAPQLDTAAIGLSMTLGAGDPAPRLVAVASGGRAWTAAASDPWIRLEPAGGVDGTLQVGVDSAALAIGEHDGTVTVTDVEDGASKTVAVHASVDPVALAVRRQAVALTSVGSVQELTATLPVADNAHGGHAWTASADQPWLHLGVSHDVTGHALPLTADPTGLSDGMHYANVSVSSTDAGMAGTAAVRVGLYVSHTDVPVASASLPARNGVSAYASGERLLADPLRPYAYRSVGNKLIDVFNVHTGKLLRQITVGQAANDMAISPDGRTLFVADQVGAAIVPVALDDFSVGALPQVVARIPTPNLVFRLATAMLGGRTVVVTSEGQVIDGGSGAVLADFQASAGTGSGSWVAVSHDGRDIILQPIYVGEQHTLSHLSLRDHGGIVDVRQLEPFQEASVQGLAVYGAAFTADDSLLVTASGGQAMAYDPANLAAGPVVLSGPAGLGTATRADGGFYTIGGFTAPGLGRFDAAGNAQGAVATSTTFVMAAVSGDQRRLVDLDSGGGAAYIGFRNSP